MAKKKDNKKKDKKYLIGILIVLLNLCLIVVMIVLIRMNLSTDVSVDDKDPSLVINEPSNESESSNSQTDDKEDNTPTGPKYEVGEHVRPNNDGINVHAIGEDEIPDDLTSAEVNNNLGLTLIMKATVSESTNPEDIAGVIPQSTDIIEYTVGADRPVQAQYNGNLSSSIIELHELPAAGPSLIEITYGSGFGEFYRRGMGTKIPLGTEYVIGEGSIIDGEIVPFLVDPYDHKQIIAYDFIETRFGLTMILEILNYSTGEYSCWAWFKDTEWSHAYMVKIEDFETDEYLITYINEVINSTVFVKNGE